MLQQADVSRHQCRNRKTKHLPERKIPGHHRQYRAQRKVANVAALRSRLHNFIRQEPFRVFRIVAANPCALCGFIHGGAKRFAHFRGHHAGAMLFFALEERSGFQHHLRALGERRFAVRRERIRRFLELHLELRVGQGLERL